MENREAQKILCPAHTDDVLSKEERYYDQEMVGWHHRPSGHEFDREKSGMLLSMELQRVRRSLVTEQQYFFPLEFPKDRFPPVQTAVDTVDLG